MFPIITGSGLIAVGIIILAVFLPLYIKELLDKRKKRD